MQSSIITFYRCLGVLMHPLGTDSSVQHSNISSFGATFLLKWAPVLCGVDSTRCKNMPMRLCSALKWLQRIISADLSAALFMPLISCCAASQMCSTGFRSGYWRCRWSTLSQTHRHIHEASGIWFLTRCIVKLKIAIRNTQSAAVLERMLNSDCDGFGIKGSVARKLSLHHHISSSSLDLWPKAGWLHGFMLVMANLSRNPGSQTRLGFFQSPAVQCRGVCVHCSLRFLFLVDSRENPVWSFV